MKHSTMTDPKESSGDKDSEQLPHTDSAFDRWLNRGLHQLFDDVMKEPVPPELLKIVQDDKKK